MLPIDENHFIEKQINLMIFTRVDVSNAVLLKRPKLLRSPCDPLLTGFDDCIGYLPPRTPLAGYVRRGLYPGRVSAPPLPPGG